MTLPLSGCRIGSVFAVALRRSMLDLLDNGVYRDAATGAPAFAYAHPIFWAPFSLVGEGGR